MNGQIKHFREIYKKSSSGSDWLFRVDEEEYDGDPTIFWIVHREYWQQNKHLDDCHIERFVEHLLPKGFGEALESGFEYCIGSAEEGRKALLDAGFQLLDK